jgi:hypothetical protein
MVGVAVDHIVDVLPGVDDRLVPAAGPVRVVGCALVDQVLPRRPEPSRGH